MPVSGGREGEDCAKTIEQESARNPRKYFIGYQDTAHRAQRTGHRSSGLRHPLRLGSPGSLKSTAGF
jgi:hypothetical protein